MASPTLDATIQALQNGPKKVPVPAAIQNIDTWATELGESKDEGLKSVAADLKNLKSLLQAGTPDDSAITTLLQKLSKSTTAAGGPNSKLQELGTLLAS